MRRARHVYVVDLGTHGAYVGQTGLEPAARYRQHKQGTTGTSRAVRLHGRGLAAVYGPFWSRGEAERAERAVARALRRHGVAVEGGH